LHPEVRSKGVFIHDSVNFLKDLTYDSMATQRQSTVFSLGGNDSDHTVSPVVSCISSTPSIVSIDSIIRHKHTTSSAVQGIPASESSTKCMSSLSVESNGNETSISGSTYSRADSTDDSFIRHHKYFFKDGNVTFLVSGSQP
jgi:hypothetical protein